MTNAEKKLRNKIYIYLRKQGYVTYSKWLAKFDINFYTPEDDELFTAAMIPDEYRILINPLIDDLASLSVLIRHEILHELYKHSIRSVKVLAKRHGLNFDELDDLSIKQLTDEVYMNKLANIAGDYELSNRMYTEKDKDIIRHLGEYTGLGAIRGLVTEDDHPEWENLDIETMYGKLLDQLEEDRKRAEKDAELGIISGYISPDGHSFSDIKNQVVYVSY